MSKKNKLEFAPYGKETRTGWTELNNNCACQKRALRKTGDDKTNHSNNIATRWQSF